MVKTNIFDCYKSILESKSSVVMVHDYKEKERIRITRQASFTVINKKSMDTFKLLYFNLLN